MQALSFDSSPRHWFNTTPHHLCTYPVGRPRAGGLTPVSSLVAHRTAA